MTHERLAELLDNLINAVRAVESIIASRRSLEEIREQEKYVQEVKQRILLESETT